MVSDYKRGENHFHRNNSGDKRILSFLFYVISKVLLSSISYKYKLTIVPIYILYPPNCSQLCIIQFSSFYLFFW